MVTRRRHRRQLSAVLPRTLLATVVVASCSTGDGRDLDLRVPPSTPPALILAPPVESSSAGAAPPTLPAEPLASPDGASPLAGDASLFDTVPEVGVPGLDADDAFCAAWSRFAGSFQVIAVGAAFGELGDGGVARLEVLASTTVAAAYADMAAEWPDELAAERSAALERRFGPFAARVGGIDALLAADGVPPDQIDALTAAWFDVLATRDPDTAAPSIALDVELEEVVARTAAAHLAAAGGWFDDASLASDVDTPLTDAHLASACPDQGTLGGQDADG